MIDNKRLTRDELLDLVPLYALGALTPEEARQVEALLESDAEARQLAAEYQQVTENLLLAVPRQDAPPDSGAKLMAKVRAGQDRQRRGRYLMLLAASFAIVLLGALLVINLDSGGTRASEAQVLYERLASEESSIHLAVTSRMGDDPTGEIVISSAGDAAVIRVQNLPNINDNQTFQLWLFDDGGSIDGGIFRVDDPAAPNYIMVPVVKTVAEYERFGVSIEPAGGSPLGNRASGEGVFVVSLAPLHD